MIFMPHANIQYSQLAPERRAWVCKNCYLPLFELVRDHDAKIAFEASGRTREVMAAEAPQVLALLKQLIAAGRIEPVGSPFIHVMLANIPPEVALHSLKRGLDAWEKYTGFRPETGWNPECGWAGYLPVLSGSRLQKSGDDANSFCLSFPKSDRTESGLRCARSRNKNTFQIEEFIKDKPEFSFTLTTVDGGTSRISPQRLMAPDALVSDGSDGVIRNAGQP